MGGRPNALTEAPFPSLCKPRALPGLMLPPAPPPFRDPTLVIVVVRGRPGRAIGRAANIRRTHN